MTTYSPGFCSNPWSTIQEHLRRTPDNRNGKGDDSFSTVVAAAPWFDRARVKIVYLSKSGFVEDEPGREEDRRISMLWRRLGGC
jgi:hypothetical protein